MPESCSGSVCADLFCEYTSCTEVFLNFAKLPGIHGYLTIYYVLWMLSLKNW